MVLRVLVLFLAALVFLGIPYEARAAEGQSAAAGEAPALIAGTAPPGTVAMPGPGHAAWTNAPAARLLLSRTPPLYEGDPGDDGARPEASIRLLRSGADLLVLLAWDDATESSPREPEAVPDAGDAHIYPEHSMDIERFADAACVMVPRARGPHEAFPSLMMGDTEDSVDLYFWHRTRGFERLEARGRGTTTRTGEPFPGESRWTSHGWEVVFQVPDVPAGTPISIALWDGGREHRDGLKFFTPWYEVRP